MTNRDYEIQALEFIKATVEKIRQATMCGWRERRDELIVSYRRQREHLIWHRKRYGRAV